MSDFICDIDKQLKEKQIQEIIASPDKFQAFVVDALLDNKNEHKQLKELIAEHKVEIKQLKDTTVTKSQITTIGGIVAGIVGFIVLVWEFLVKNK